MIHDFLENKCRTECSLGPLLGNQDWFLLAPCCQLGNSFNSAAWAQLANKVYVQEVNNLFGQRTTSVSKDQSDSTGFDRIFSNQFSFSSAGFGLGLAEEKPNFGFTPWAREE